MYSKIQSFMELILNKLQFNAPENNYFPQDIF